jgi:ABC-type multidrug transport system fused ATPase/permease subunit
LSSNYERSRALPMFGDGDVPTDRDRSVDEDDSGFMDVLTLLLRSWPFIRPQFLGQWWIKGKGVEDRVAEPVAGDGFSFQYAPFLVLAAAISGPLFGFVPPTLAWPFDLLYVPIAAMVVAMYFLAFSTGRAQLIATVVLLLSGIAANVVATYVIDGYPDGLYVAGITICCLIGWTVQYRYADGRFEFRIRIGTHLVYFYAINFFQRFLALSLALIVADLLNQSLLQNAPLAPGLADLFGLPGWSKEAVDALTQEQRHELKWLFAGIALAVTLLQIILSTISGYYNIWIMQRINQDLRVALLERWHQLSLSYHSEHRTGDSIYRIYQDSSMVTAVIGNLIGITLALMSYYTCVALVTLLSPWIGLIAGLLVIPALLWASWAMPRMRVRTLVYRAATSDVTSTIQETFGAIRLIKAFNATDRAERRMEQDSIVAFNAAYRVRLLIAMVSIVMFTLAATFMITGEFLMVWWAHQTDPTYATELIALVGVSFVVWNLASFSWTRDQLRESSGDLRKLLRDWMTAQDMAMGLRRVFDILDIEPDIKDNKDAIPMTGFTNEIFYNNVSFAYEPDRQVLDQVSFKVKPGSVTAIIGPTGSGKTTLMALLLRLYEPNAGTISIDGRPLADYQVETLRARIAIALQENVLFAMSVAENIRYVAPEATAEQVQEAVRISAMEDFVAGLPEGLDTVLSDRGGKLSTGQRQRLSIARAVVRDTPILILDEPTAALDAITEHQVMTNLTEWVRDEHAGNSGRAIFLITHRISTIRRADNILYLEDGNILETGDHDTLMQITDGKYRNFVETESDLITQSDTDHD